MPCLRPGLKILKLPSGPSGKYQLPRLCGSFVCPRPQVAPEGPCTFVFCKVTAFGYLSQCLPLSLQLPYGLEPLVPQFLFPRDV